MPDLLMDGHIYGFEVVEAVLVNYAQFAHGWSHMYSGIAHDPVPGQSPPRSR